MSLELTYKCLTGLESKLCVVLGSQWGDEGKGKLVDILAEKYNYCARFNGGANAGHTIIKNGKKLVFHLLPCGLGYEKVKNILGNGVVINLPQMFEELENLEKNGIDWKDRLFISNRAHLTTQLQLALDSQNEADPGQTFLGTTKRGIGPTYGAKANRFGLRMGDLLYWDNFKEKYMQMHKNLTKTQNIKVDAEKDLEQIKYFADIIIKNKMIVDTVNMVHDIISNKKNRMIVEGANAVMLDLDFGTYPYVTSSTTWLGGATTGLGIPPSFIETQIGVVKAYTTRVGEGPFPTFIKEDVGKFLQKEGNEFGATTGRPRKCGWLDMQQLNYANKLNNFSSINISKLDILSKLDEIKLGIGYRIKGKKIDYIPSTIYELEQVEVDYEVHKGWKKDISKCKTFEELPSEARDYVKRIESLMKVPVSWIGIGPKPTDMIQKMH